MATVWLVTNGGSGGQYGDDWIVDTIHTTQASAAARAAGERWFDEVEEWEIHGSLLTDEEREAIGRLTKHHEFHPDDPDKRGRMTWISSDAAAVLRHLLERTK